MQDWGAKLVELAGIVSNNLILDFGGVGGAGIVFGSAAGWFIGVLADGMGKRPAAATATTWAAGAGAFCGVLIVVFHRTLG